MYSFQIGHGNSALTINSKAPFTINSSNGSFEVAPCTPPFKTKQKIKTRFLQPKYLTKEHKNTIAAFFLSRNGETKPEHVDFLASIPALQGLDKAFIGKYYLSSMHYRIACGDLQVADPAAYANHLKIISGWKWDIYNSKRKERLAKLT
jgi:hypothetical protein